MVCKHLSVLLSTCYFYMIVVLFLSVFFSQLMHEEVDILCVLISLNKNSSLQVWFAVLVTIAMELDLKSSHHPETKIPGLTPMLVNPLIPLCETASWTLQDVAAAIRTKIWGKDVLLKIQGNSTFIQVRHLVFFLFWTSLSFMCLRLVAVPMCFPSKPDTFSSILVIVSFTLQLPFSSASHLSMYSMGVHGFVSDRSLRSSSCNMPKINLRCALSSLEADLSQRTSGDSLFNKRDEWIVAFTVWSEYWEGNSVVEKREKAACSTD